MPSPFPGMDPYLEAPDIWPDFHDRLAEITSALLNEQLPDRFYGKLARPRTNVSESIEFVVQSEPIRHAFVEIRDRTRGHHLVTLLEIASPANKSAGPDRQSYLKKQQEVLQSDASLIEI